MGLGLHGGGVGVVKFFVEQGAKVLVTDLRTKKELRESIERLKKHPIKYVLGKHRAEDFKNADMVIKNPAVPKDSKYLKIAKKNGVSIETDVGLFFELCPSKKIIGITGTKGKSTTATLIYKILSQKFTPHPKRRGAGFNNIVLAGNIGYSVLEDLEKINKNTIVVLELSSWQLEGLEKHKKSPPIAVFTNIMPDHLNRYRSMRDYIEAKKLIFKFQEPKDWLVLNYDDKAVRGLVNEAKSRAIFYSTSFGIVDSHKKSGAYIDEDKILFGEKRQKICNLKDVKLVGEHNLSNVLAAITVAELLGIPDGLIKKGLQKFYGLRGRIEFIKEFRGIKYYNDTTATTPEAIIAALQSFPLVRGKIILIAGGADKNLNFQDLAKEILERVKILILLRGTATPKIEKAVRLRAQKRSLKVGLIILKAKNMKEAVEKASRQAEENDIVLLSPGCASFGLFKHEFHRGEEFNKGVHRLQNYK